jgi:DnaJ-like protein
MSFEKIVEDQIRKAVADGEFDNLRGKGKPLDLEGYFETPGPLRMAYSMLKSAEFVPEEVQLMQEIEEGRLEIASCTDVKRARHLECEIQQKQLALNVLLERQQRRKK